ncbi:A/G-specific adenine glycosylase [Ensifer soli]|uniref:A/G-specific adenine glycosylase n=1 Tax=Ciceribacter sp. sgz301302 TaxID=3342379 RepID=UPI0035B9A333
MMTDPEQSPLPARLILNWYDRHHRSLPWRITPPMAKAGRTADPYHVWLSEVMLQQTTVQAVKPYFETFLSLWPTVDALAAAETEAVMQAWAGLGYYARARNLKKCAETVSRDHSGRFPDTEEALKRLPGIGDYTAAAIAAIAFNRQSAVLDGNVERVVSRLHAVETPLPSARPALRALTAAITPADRPGDFAQAMMDLGATICTPKRPACALCPLNGLCRARRDGDPERYPLKAAKKTKPERKGAAFVAIDGDGAVLLRKRGGTGLLAGMTEVPGSAWTARADGETDTGAAPFPARWEACGGIRHVFTHFALELTVYRVRLAARVNPPEGWWEPSATLAAQALPTVMKKVITQAIPGAFPRKDIVT